MPIKICDAICGKGKTSSAINMMNSSTDDKFIFITQYLTEVDRIKTACASRNFTSPEFNPKTGTAKLANLHELMAAGRNIASTHALFLNYTNETKRLIEEQHYILVIDEVVDVIQESNISAKDIKILLNSKTIAEEDGLLIWNDDEYDEEKGRFKDEMRRAKSHNLMQLEQGMYFWILPPELFALFKEVYVLTYMFESQELRCCFDLYGLKYEYIGTKKQNSTYTFCDVSEMDRREDIRDKVHILDHHKLNRIGDGRGALSYTWYARNVARGGSDLMHQVKNNLQNLFRNIYKAKSEDTMWTSFKSGANMLRGKGYWTAFVPYNKRASNDYADKRYLAYCVNIFPRPWEQRFFQQNGVRPLDDMYALSSLIQWLFRSAIRNGKEVWIYIPSRRMRKLLEQWMDNLAEGKDLETISYTTPRKQNYDTQGRRRGRPRKEKKYENN